MSIPNCHKGTISHCFEGPKEDESRVTVNNSLVRGSVFICKLGSKMTEDDIMKATEEFLVENDLTTVQITAVKIFKTKSGVSKGYGFVELDDDNACALLIEKKELMIGSKLVVVSQARRKHAEEMICRLEHAGVSSSSVDSCKVSQSGLSSSKPDSVVPEPLESPRATPLYSPRATPIYSPTATLYSSHPSLRVPLSPVMPPSHGLQTPTKSIPIRLSQYEYSNASIPSISTTAIMSPKSTMISLFPGMMPATSTMMSPMSPTATLISPMPSRTTMMSPMQQPSTMMSPMQQPSTMMSPMQQPSTMMSPMSTTSTIMSPMMSPMHTLMPFPSMATPMTSPIPNMMMGPRPIQMGPVQLVQDPYYNLMYCQMSRAASYSVPRLQQRSVPVYVMPQVPN